MNVSDDGKLGAITSNKDINSAVAKLERIRSSVKYDLAKTREAQLARLAELKKLYPKQLAPVNSGPRLHSGLIQRNNREPGLIIEEKSDENKSRKSSKSHKKKLNLSDSSKKLIDHDSKFETHFSKNSILLDKGKQSQRIRRHQTAPNNAGVLSENSHKKQITQVNRDRPSTGGNSQKNTSISRGDYRDLGELVDVTIDNCTTADYNGVPKPTLAFGKTTTMDNAGNSCKLPEDKNPSPLFLPPITR